MQLYALFLAHTVSLTGGMITWLALPLYVLQETDSASAAGLAGVVATLPIVLGGLLGGTIVDRLGHRRASILTDVGGGFFIMLVPLLSMSIGLPLWAVFALVFTGNLIDAPGQTARHALLPEVAKSAGVPLERAVGWMEATERGARMLGAPLAGFLVVFAGALEALLVDTASFVVSALLVALLVRDAPVEKTASDGYWRELGAGLRFIAQEPLMRAVVLIVVVTNFFDAASSSVLLPVYADRELGGAVALGLLVGAMGGGALAGSFLFGIIGHRLPRRPTLIIAFTLAGGPMYLALAAGVPFGVLLALKAGAGFCAGAVNPIIGTVSLERIPPSMRARAFGLLHAGCWAGMPLGSLAAGFAVDHMGLTATLVFVGVCYLIATLQPLRGGVWKGLDRPDSAPALPAEEPRVGALSGSEAPNSRGGS